MKTKMLSLLLCLVMLVGVLPMSALSAAAAQNESAPVGTAANPYVVEKYYQLRNYIKEYRDRGEVVYVKLGDNLTYRGTEGDLVTNGADVVIDLAGYTISCETEYLDYMMYGKNGKFIIRDSRRFDLDKGQMVDGRIEYEYRKYNDDGWITFFNVTNMLAGDFVIEGGVLVNKNYKDTRIDSVYKGDSLVMTGGTLEGCYPIIYSLNTWSSYSKKCEIRGGTLRARLSSNAAIVVNLSTSQSTEAASYPKITDCEIVNASGGAQVSAIELKFPKDAADTLSYDRAAAFYAGLFPAGTVTYIDGYKMASSAAQFRYYSGVSSVYSSLYSSNYRIVTPEEISSIALTIPEPKANDKITYNAEAPADAGYMLNASYGDSNYWSRGVCWTRDGTIGPMNCHVQFSFVQGRKYKAEIAVKLKDNQQYLFADTPAATINGKAATVTDAGDGTYIVSREFPIPTTLNNFVLYVTEPKAGQQAKYDAYAPGGMNYKVDTSAGGSLWKNGVLWRLGTAALPNSPAPTFQPGKDYTVLIMVVPKNTEESLFADAAACTATVNGKTAQVSRVEDNKYAVYYTYHLPYVVENVAVTIPAPKAGQKPSYDASVPAGNGYALGEYEDDPNSDNGVLWEDENGYVVFPNSTLTEGKKYTVSVVLKLADGAERFADADKIKATVNGAAANVRLYEDECIISCVFTAAKNTQTVINTVSVTVPEPLAGERMPYTATVPAGKGYAVQDWNNPRWQHGVCWKDEDNSQIAVADEKRFEPGKQYTVIVCLELTDSEKYAFAPAAQLTALVNGKEASVEDYNDGTYGILYTFTVPASSAGYIIGDADTNGKISILDATAIQRKLANLPVSAYNEKAADADEDGKVSILDATAVQRYLASLSTNPNIGKQAG